MLLSAAILYFFINVVTSEGQTGPNLVHILNTPSAPSTPSPPPATGCPINFTGAKCEIPICDSTNGQLVYRSPDEYFCKCKDGIVGTHCETIICQNGGTPIGSTECDCSKTGYTGQFCNLGGPTPAPEPVKDEKKNYFFTWTLVIYTLAVGIFYSCVAESRKKANTFTHVDAPYSASRPESKLYNFYYYAFVSKDVKLY